VGLLVSTASAKTYTYNVSFSADYSGPYTYLMKSADPAQKIFLHWWNETVGKNLGVEVVRKAYDTRYNPAVVASLWPGILSGDKPIAHMGLGGCDVASLMKRLPSDKVPMFMSTATYGFCWLPNQWMFQPRPTYAHEFRGFLSWVLKNWKEDRPVRIGALSTQGIPAYEDQIKGVKQFCSDDPKFEFVGVEWIKLVPVSVSSEVKRLAEKKPDYIYMGTNVHQVVALIRAEEELGIHIPAVMATHTDLIISAKALSWKELENNFDVGACNSSLDKTIEAYKLFEQYRPELAPDAPWDLNAVQFGGQIVLTLRAIERAVKKAGAANITGQAVYDAMYEAPFTEENLLGLWPTLKYTKKAPFSTYDMKVKSSTVRNGKHVLTSPDWLPIPEIKKW
jgi:branched-chain amino acid transport system substrate-binding protein